VNGLNVALMRVRALCFRTDNKLLCPPIVAGVKLMSYGFVAKGASAGRVSAAVMRGPMLSKVVTQLISGTDWGHLDYLLVDLPPVSGCGVLLSNRLGSTAA